MTQGATLPDTGESPDALSKKPCTAGPGRFWSKKREATLRAAAPARPAAVIRWRAAIHALDRGLLPCSSSEAAILRVAASLGDDAVPVHLRSVLGSLDRRNITLVTAALAAANGS